MVSSTSTRFHSASTASPLKLLDSLRNRKCWSWSPVLRRYLHYQLAIAAAQEKVTVTASPEDLNPDSPRRDILISQQQIARYAGVDSSNSFKIITEFVPGSYMVHDQLHVRGGHQVTWAIDGVPVPNTNIASNVGTAVQSQGCLVPPG